MDKFNIYSVLFILLVFCAPCHLYSFDGNYINPKNGIVLSFKNNGIVKVTFINIPSYGKYEIRGGDILISDPRGMIAFSFGPDKKSLTTDYPIFSGKYYRTGSLRKDIEYGMNQYEVMCIEKSKLKGQNNEWLYYNGIYKNSKSEILYKFEENCLTMKLYICPINCFEKLKNDIQKIYKVVNEENIEKNIDGEIKRNTLFWANKNGETSVLYKTEGVKTVIIKSNTSYQEIKNFLMNDS